MEKIVSTRNDKVKLIRSLSDKKSRDAAGLYIIEGHNIIKDMPACARAQELFVKESSLSKYTEISKQLNIKTTVLADFVFDSVADTASTNGILCLAQTTLGDKIIGDFVVVADGISDAGNMGTILRTAAAMGVTDVISLGSVDFFNPKVVRSSMGGIFNLNLISCDKPSATALLKGFTVAALDMAGEDIYDYRMPSKFALVVGSEAHGVSQECKSLSKAILSIPMIGKKMESLNAAVSVGIALSVLSHNKQKGE